jgi:CRP/FNR family transcriptional regulator, anaerobic regulatory protein
MKNSIFTDARLLEEIRRNTRVKKVSKDEVLMSSGDDIFFVPIVQQGVVRIMREDYDGNEVFLYHLYPGQTCAMTINCCQSGKKSMVKAITEKNTEVLLVPVNLVEDWLKYPEWKTFVNLTYNNRFAELMQVIDLIAFSNLDKQLLHYLQERTKATNIKTLKVTHQQIANELHTRREVISRLLRTMEQKDMVKLGRNTIELILV